MSATDVVFRMSLGGWVIGVFVGILGGAIVGIVSGILVGDYSLGLDGALFGGLGSGVIGGIVGLRIGLRDKSDMLSRVEHPTSDRIARTEAHTETVPRPGWLSAKARRPW